MLPSPGVMPQCPRHLANPDGALHPATAPCAAGPCWGRAEPRAGGVSRLAPGEKRGPGLPPARQPGCKNCVCRCRRLNLVCSVACPCFDVGSGEITPTGQRGHRNGDAARGMASQPMQLSHPLGGILPGAAGRSLPWVNPLLLMHQIESSVAPRTPAAHFVSRQRAATVHGPQRSSAAVNYEQLLPSGTGGWIRSVFCPLTSCSHGIDKPALSDCYICKSIFVSPE